MRIKMHLKQFIGIMIFMTTSTINATEVQPNSSVKIFNSKALYDPTSYGYSHAVVAGNIAYISGQGGENKNGKLEDDFAIQVRQSYKNLAAALASVNSRPANVTKLTTYVVAYEQSMLDVMTKELKALFGDHLPAQTLVPVPRLAIDGMLFEVDAIAIIESN